MVSRWMAICSFAANILCTAAFERTRWPDIAYSSTDEGSQPHKQVERICVKDFPISKENITLGKPWWAPQLSERLYLRSKRSRPETTITLVTFTSLARFQPLDLQCKNWPGPIAASMYVARTGGRVAYPPGGQGGSLLQGATDTPTLLRQTRLLHDTLQPEEDMTNSPQYKCMLDLALYTEEVPTTDEDWWSVPISALLNRALAMAQTELVLVVDGDYIPVPSAFAPLWDQGGALLGPLEEQLRTNNAALALLGLDPSAAFNEGTPLDEQVRWVMSILEQGSKELAVSMVDEGKLVVASLQSETNWTHWRSANAVYPAMFNWSAVFDELTPTEYDPPYLAVLSTLPYYDERYRGPYYNTAGHMYHITRIPLQLLVHPTAYLIHYPHGVDTVEDQSSKLAGKMRYLYYRMIPDKYRYWQGPHLPVINDDAVCTPQTDHSILGLA